jgi:hypothetical protein
MNTHALLVGIEKYDHPDWDVEGPCTNAIEVAKWLISIGSLPTRIHMFLDPAQDLDQEIENLKRAGVQVDITTDSTTIDTFWRTKLTKGCEANSRLLIFWSGHGFTSGKGNRIFFCRDYTEELPGRVFNGSNFLRHLRTVGYRCFAEQIFLADVCGVYSDLPIVEAPEHVKQGRTLQLAYFATPEGEYAKGLEGQGVFTEEALKVLRQAGGWPDHDAFARALEGALEKIDAAPFRISGFNRRGEIQEARIGSVAKIAGNVHFQSVFGLLDDLDVTADVFLPHYLRTVTDLGDPALAKAQGLVGTVKMLSSLSDGDAIRAPEGLLQFLLRLAGEPALKQPIGDWLEKHAAARKNTLHRIKKKLEVEAQQKILMILVEINDEKREIAAFKPYLCNNDFSLVAGRSFERRAVDDWDDFTRSLQELLREFTVQGRLSNLEIHFIADAPLFDRPFHLIPVAPEQDSPIGEQAVVVLRHRQRALSSDRLVRDRWTEYADALRPTPTNELRWLKIDPGKVALPEEKGLCFAGFILPLSQQGGVACESEKQRLHQLLNIGAPYLYLPHVAPQEADWRAIETALTKLLANIKTLDRFPAAFTTARSRGSDFACQATILWDDPLFNPFTSTKGVSTE